MVSLSIPQTNDHMKPRITVIGVGGAGGNAVNNMIRANLEGVEFLIANTDAQAMMQSLASRKIQLGTNITRGLGAGARADVGRAAAEEAINEILESIQGSNMVFITAGMGGGTGTGAAPVIARAAREHGILTVGVVTKPFHFEGSLRMKQAEAGIEQLQDHVDTLIIIPNQNLFRIANEQTTFADAFNMADQVLHSGVRGVTDLMVMPGLINLDFNDIRSVMSEMGKAMMGTGEAEGARRAVDAAESAISNPLLDDVSMKGARGVLINITGGTDMTLFEVDEAANRIRDEVDPEANIIFGSTFDQSMNGKMRVSVVATGIEADVARRTNNDRMRTMAPNAQPNPFASMTAANNGGGSVSAPAAMRVSSLGSGSNQSTSASPANNTSPFAGTSPSNSNATPPAAATASAYGAGAASADKSAGINLRPMSQNTNSTYGQTSAPMTMARSAQPTSTGQGGLRVTSTAPSQSNTPTATTPQYQTAPQSYGNAALQMAPAQSAPAQTTPSPNLTVIAREITQTFEPDFAHLYDETPQSAEPSSPWVSVAPTAPTSQQVTSSSLATSHQQQQTMRMNEAAPTQPSLFSEQDRPQQTLAQTATESKKKGPSLFERVTGMATGKKAGPEIEDHDNARTNGFMGLNLGNSNTSESNTLEPQRREPQLVNQQPAKLSQADEDLLEIPAFLRRQAN